MRDQSFEWQRSAILLDTFGLIKWETLCLNNQFAWLSNLNYWEIFSCVCLMTFYEPNKVLLGLLSLVHGSSVKQVPHVSPNILVWCHIMLLYNSTCANLPPCVIITIFLVYTTSNCRETKQIIVLQLKTGRSLHFLLLKLFYMTVFLRTTLDFGNVYVVWWNWYLERAGVAGRRNYPMFFTNLLIDTKSYSKRFWEDKSVE